MIQSVLIFSLGFLCSAFLALMIAPAIWRRAVVLTRKRIEASVPLSLNEIQADKDRMRAEFAMSTRRLEMSVKSFKEKATGQIVDITRARDELQHLAEERDESNRAASDLESKEAELRAEMRNREAELERVNVMLRDADRRLEERSQELERLGQDLDETSVLSSNRQVELVARETEVEKLAGDLDDLQVQRKEAAQRIRELERENKVAQNAIRAESKRTADLEKKLDRLGTTLSDREEKLARREKELSRVREELKRTTSESGKLNKSLVAADKQRVKLEADLAEMSLQMTTMLSGATGGDIEKAIGKLERERTRIEDRLKTTLRENKKLSSDLAALERSKSGEWEEQRHENAVLREQINDLAAEVVTLTAALEGPDSPINKTLAAPEVPADIREEIGKTTTSLAERMRALQKAAAAR